MIAWPRRSQSRAGLDSGKQVGPIPADRGTSGQNLDLAEFPEYWQVAIAADDHHRCRRVMQLVQGTLLHPMIGQHRASKCQQAGRFR